MTERDRHDDPTTNKAFGTAGHETGKEEPSEVGSAGLYAAPVHEEGEEALEEGRKRAEKPVR